VDECKPLATGDDYGYGAPAAAQQQQQPLNIQFNSRTYVRPGAPPLENKAYLQNPSRPGLADIARHIIQRVLNPRFGLNGGYREP
jgi:hypothetical protein